MTDPSPLQHAGFTEDRVNNYDKRVRKHIPGYEVLHAIAETLLATELKETASILTVGVGTGPEILEWAPRHPGWSFYGTDTAPAMLKLAQEKVNAAKLSDRVRLKAGDTDEWPDETFDAATLMLVLHFVPKADKLDMLASIADRLNPGAPFLIANLFGEIDSTRFKRLNTGRKAWAVSKGLSTEAAEEFCDPHRSDMHIVPEESLKSLLRDAGFIDIQRVYQALTVGVWFARVPR